MTVSFPSSPSVGDTVTDAGSGAAWTWDGNKWVVVGGGGGGGAALPNGTAAGQLLTWDGTVWGPAALATTGTGNIYVRQQGPTINQPRIMGVTDGSDAAAGEVGEYIASSYLWGTIDHTGGTFTMTGSLDLPVGDWLVSGRFAFAITPPTAGWLTIGSHTDPPGINLGIVQSTIYAQADLQNTFDAAYPSARVKGPQSIAARAALTTSLTAGGTIGAYLWAWRMR